MNVAVLGSCGPAGINVMRALLEAGHRVEGWDDNELHLEFGKRLGVMHHAWPQDLRELDRFDAVHTQVTGRVAEIAKAGLPVMVPGDWTLEVCRHKDRAAMQWWKYGVRLLPPELIGQPHLDYLHLAADRLGLPFWLRAREGSGARGATLVESIAQAHHWIRYWQEQHTTWEWVAEEYLPGDDYCYTSLWQNGVQIGAFTRQRLEWLYPHLTPSGRTGTPTFAVTVHNDQVRTAAVSAIRTIEQVTGEPANGILCVDLRCDRDGKPRPTEINAGRWATTSPLYGPELPDLHVRGCAGESLPLLGQDIYPAGNMLARHIDCGSTLIETWLP